MFITAISVSAQPHEKSTEDRVHEMEGSPPSSGTDSAQNNATERDLAEIKSQGLIDRAFKEFSERFPKATIREWKAGYFKTREVVVFSILYTDAGSPNYTRQQELGFRKENSEWKIFWLGGHPSEPTSQRDLKQ